MHWRSKHVKQSFIFRRSFFFISTKEIIRSIGPTSASMNPFQGQSYYAICSWHLDYQSIASDEQQKYYLEDIVVG